MALRLQRTARSPTGAALALLMLGEAELLAGRLDEAEDHLKEAAEANDRQGCISGAALARLTTEIVPLFGEVGSLTTIRRSSSGDPNTVDAFWSSVTGWFSTVASVAHGAGALSGQTSATLPTLNE